VRDAGFEHLSEEEETEENEDSVEWV